MLTLTRRPGEGLYLGGDIYLRVVRITPTKIELAIDCPRTTRIVRAEAAAGWRTSTLNPQPSTLNPPRPLERQTG